MNERIKDLWWKARIGYNEQNCDPEVLEKFAQVLIQECGEWFNRRLVVEPDYGMEHRIERNRAVVGVMKEFNQHFGVR